MNSYARIWKRVSDIALAALGLTLLALPMLVIALAVFVASGRPIIFSQERVGRYGRLFSIHKFRTMVASAMLRGEKQPRSIANGDSTVTVEGDRRITPIGRFLRRWKLDELPQLWNVLVGEMSFVGPRPDVPGFADALEGDDRRILLLRPGVTGPATLFFRDEEELLASVPDPVGFNRDVIYPRKVKVNLEYIDQCSLLVDLRLIWNTVVPGKERRNAGYLMPGV